MSEFYMTLPSNACTKIFPENSLTSYMIRLDRPLRLHGNWVVNMVEMHYPNSWDNVTDGRIIVRQTPDSAKLMFLKTGRYRSIDDIFEGILSTLSSFNLQGSIDFFRDKNQNICSVVVKEKDLRIKLSENLSNILGLKHEYHAFGETKGVRQCDIAEGLSSLYVYSNIVEPQIVGDVQAELLRIVPIRDKNRAYNHVESFQHVQYLPVSDDGTETIKVLIRRDDGREIYFHTGKVVVTLHFKRA